MRVLKFLQLLPVAFVAIGATGALSTYFFPDLSGHYTRDQSPTFYPAAVEAAVREHLRDPDSAEFGPMHVYDDRKWAGRNVTFVCGSVNAKNGFGGYAGERNYVYINTIGIAEVDPGINNFKFVKTWNQLCAGKHSSS